MQRLMLGVAMLFATGAYADTYTTTLVVPDTGSGCTVCGDVGAYVQPGFGEALSFTDQTPANGVVTGISVQVGFIEGATINMTVVLGPTTIGPQEIAGQSQACGQCDLAVFATSTTSPSGLPGWSYQGDNVVQVLNTGGTNDDAFYMGQAVVTVTYFVPGTLAASPTSGDVPPMGTIAFSATSGSSDHYQWSLSTNGSHGSIDATSGAYVAGTAGGASGATDVVSLTDGTQTVLVNVNVGPTITLSPASPDAVAPATSLTFSAAGGDGNYTMADVFTFSLGPNSSGGGIDAKSGVYTAGSKFGTKGGQDTVIVTDDIGNTTSVNVPVGAGLSIDPASSILAPAGTILFAATGGTPPYMYALTTNGSNGSLADMVMLDETTYTAGAGVTKTSTFDVLTVTDSKMQTVTADIEVTPALLITLSSTAAVSPLGSVSFTVSGGNTPYSAAFVSNDESGGAVINGSTYTAGTTGSTSNAAVTDTIAVTDANKVTATAQISVGPGLSVTTMPAPASIAPLGTITLTAAGGDVADDYYAWTVSSAPSGGSFKSGASSTFGTTVTYFAGTAAGSDQITLTDMDGNTLTLTVTVTAPITVTPKTPSAPPNGPITFTGIGGTNAGYAWAFVPAVGMTPSGNHSGGTIMEGNGGMGLPDTGLYVAGTKANTNDRIQVTDGNGNVAVVSISVGNGVSITPASTTTFPNDPVMLTAMFGSGTGYKWSVLTNNSGGKFADPTVGTYLTGTSGALSRTNPTNTDIVQVTDSDGNTATATVTVGPNIVVTPTTPSTTVDGKVSFGATGGNGGPYTYTVTSTTPHGAFQVANPNIYVAASAGSDTIGVADSLGNTATATVNIAAGPSIMSSSTFVAPKATLTLTASGGTGPYSWAVTTHPSGGMITTPGAQVTYTAGTGGGTEGTTDIVTVTDVNGAQATIDLTVTAGVTISPSSPATSPSTSIAFSAQGGTNSGFVWSFGTNASNGTINASTGAYTAGAKAKAVDVIDVHDGKGNTASVNVAVGTAVAINPSTPAPVPGQAVAFTAAGGSGSYTWGVSKNLSGATINPSTGAYIAGRQGGVTDVVQVTDTNDVSASVAVKVGADVSLNPPTASEKSGTTVYFSVSGGSGTGYTFAVSTNASGSSISATGVYTAGPMTGTDTVTATDSFGNTDSATVNVTATITLGSGDMGPNVDSGGDGFLLASDFGITGDAGNVGPSGKKSSGCGCTVGGAHDSTSGVGLMMLAALFVWRRRRA